MLIGLGHAARVGKDTAAQLLIEHHGFERVAFADGVRDLLYRTDSDVAAIVDVHGWDEAKANPHVRGGLVDIGNGCREVLGADCWIRAAFARLGPRAVITDVRYPNEAAAIKAAGGLLVKIERPGVEPLPNVADQALASFDGWDAMISNDASLGWLKTQLDSLVLEARDLAACS